MIYYYLFEHVYIQMRENAYLWNLRLDQIDGGKASPARQLTILRACRRLWEESSRILYGENLFRFYIGSEKFNTTLLKRRTTDLMQDIEIQLNPSTDMESVRVLQLFGIPNISRKSCFIKLQFRKLELMSNNIIEALKQMKGFRTLTFEIHVPGAVRCVRNPDDPTSRGHFPWISGLLAFIQTSLTPAMGPGTFANDEYFRRLIFQPQGREGCKTEEAQVAE